MPSVISKSCAVMLESTYVLIAFADARVSSLADTLVRSVSNTPLLRLSTSKFETVLLSASTVLLVSVSVPASVAKSSSLKAVLNSAVVPLRVLSVRSIDLLVSVWVSLNVATVLSMFTVRVWSTALVSIPVPPAISKD